ncbi:hypothetical protein [Streptantibioticus cattleyicolor]|uniref:ABC-2 type transport system permease protein n=1 Tax=Streptantibioticus cattleyicolor (strain ATCC 35852 / DSM 46488 / JCM 4925 / NBRC 14057 / NRRL 8057) TaxID=1003195 RepID=F8JN53_STREN|nr:hypothetical protein [Streptantibioticus cattleyicolor]AEW99196.1 hypothetical protein SCATT_p10030 [Streptantibioticus cattleyicolor NRRL 8057 = DSM 46488]CCB71761.1 membrane protein of unknown function [Streptantibioticus cattleyicolor NRRL 8057 = DSM 46488]
MKTTTGSADHPPADEEHAAAWSEEDDWTEETLRLLRSLRAPHRRKRAGEIGYVLYCVVLVLVAWGALPSLGLFLQTSLGADYTGLRQPVLRALPAGSCALALAVLVLAARDALWRGPVVPPRESVDWLLTQPVRVGRLLRPWLWVSGGASLAVGVVAAGVGMVALGLTVGVGLPAAFGWCLAGTATVPVLGTVIGVAVERHGRAARWARRAAPWASLAVLALVAQCVLAVLGHPVRWLERVELWSGPWGWAGLAALSPTPAAVPGGAVAAAALLVLGAAASWWAVRAAGAIPLAEVRRRSRTASGVKTALLTVELRTARQVASGASGGARVGRIRLPAPRRAALAVPWRDAVALLRAPGRAMRTVPATVLAVLSGVVAAGAHRGTALVAVLAALTFGYWAITQLLEPARLETDDTRRASWAPYRFPNLMMRHLVVPAVLGLLLSVPVVVAVVLCGGGWRATLAPAAVPALIAAALVNACRGAGRQHLLLSPAQTPTGSAGPLLYLLWYCSGPLATLAVLCVPYTLALHRPDGPAVPAACAVSLAATAGLLRWAWARARKFTR